MYLLDANDIITTKTNSIKISPGRYTTIPFNRRQPVKANGSIDPKCYVACNLMKCHRKCGSGIVQASPMKAQNIDGIDGEEVKCWKVGKYQHLLFCLFVRSFVCAVAVSPSCRLRNLLTENIPLAHTSSLFVYLCGPKCSAMSHVVIAVLVNFHTRTRSFARTRLH